MLMRSRDAYDFRVRTFAIGKIRVMDVAFLSHDRRLNS